MKVMTLDGKKNNPHIKLLKDYSFSGKVKNPKIIS